MWRNLVAVILGVSVALVIITVGITLNENWIEFEGDLPYEHWRQVIKRANVENIEWFFVAMLISCGVGAIVGGIITAILVKNAKTAYAVFIGFLLFVIAYLDIIFTPNHPTYYELLVFPVVFFFSWLGGKIVDLIYKNQVKSIKNN